MNKLMVFVAGLLGLAMVGYALGPGFFGGFGFVRTAGPAMSVANAKNMTLADKASLLQAIYTDDSSLYSSVLQNYGINRTINQTNFDARSQIANERLQIYSAIAAQNWTQAVTLQDQLNQQLKSNAQARTNQMLQNLDQRIQARLNSTSSTNPAPFGRGMGGRFGRGSGSGMGGFRWMGGNVNANNAQANPSAVTGSS